MSHALIVALSSLEGLVILVTSCLPVLVLQISTLTKQTSFTEEPPNHSLAGFQRLYLIITTPRGLSTHFQVPTDVRCCKIDERVKMRWWKETKIMVKNSSHPLFKGGLHSPQRPTNQNSYVEPTKLTGDLVIASRSDFVRQVKGIYLTSYTVITILTFM